MKNNIVMFATYSEAFRAAANALKDGFNTVIRQCTWGETTTWACEYFKKDSERIRDI